MKKSGFVKLPCRMIGNATGSEFQVYAYVASLSSFDKEGAYPSAATIAEKTGLSHNTVDVALRGLIERGFLQCERRGKRRFLSAPKIGVDDAPKIGVDDAPKIGVDDAPKIGVVDRLNIERFEIDRGERERTPPPARENYPQSVEDVLKIAEDPRCGMECTREQADKYFVTRDTRNWVDACGRKIQPGKVYGDLKRWLLRDQSDTKKPRGAGEGDWRV